MNKIKKKIVNDILSSGLVKPYDIIEHSYTDGGERDISRLVKSTDGVLPSMTTRPDTLGVVIDEQE